MRTLSICFVCLVGLSVGQMPNVCKSFMDYFTMNSKNCWYDPLTDADAEELIKGNGYPFEEYEVETPDGYLLTVFRIPRENPKGVIFLQHPATTSCTGWIDKRNDSFAFMLWDANYDVWMGNFRGNYYSRKHKFLNPNEQPFWNFSFHELGVYDIPTQLDLTINVTKVKPQGISFVGYSMGSTAALIYATERAEHSHKWLNIMVLWGPAAFLRYVHSIVKGLSDSEQVLMNMAKSQNLVELIPRNKMIRDLQEVCRRPPIMFLCMIIDLAVFGNAPEELGPKYYPARYSQVPAGMSTKAYIHYLQLAKSERFRNYDYGPEKNLEYYHSVEPPDYNINNIQCPMYFMYGDHDLPVPQKDVEYLYSLLPERAKIYGKRLIKNFAHQSFFYGTHVIDWVYTPMIKMFDDIFDKLQ